MPRKIRQLRGDLRRSGFVLNPKRGKGSHTWWTHPKLPGYSVNISGNEGDDARQYQERAVQEALERVRGVN